MVKGSNILSMAKDMSLKVTSMLGYASKKCANWILEVTVQLSEKDAKHAKARLNVKRFWLFDKKYNDSSRGIKIVIGAIGP